MKKTIIAGIIVGVLFLAGCGSKLNPGNSEEETTPSVTNTVESTQNKQDQNTSDDNKKTEATTASENTKTENEPASSSSTIIPDGLNETNIDQFFGTLSSPPQYLMKDWILVEYGFPIFIKFETWIGDKKTSWGEMNEFKIEKPSKDIFKAPDTLKFVDFG